MFQCHREGPQGIMEPNEIEPSSNEQIMKSQNEEEKTDKRNKICGIKCFTFVITLHLLLMRMGNGYFTGILRTLEKQYGFTGLQSGLLFSSYNISTVVALLLLGYMGDKFKKPVILGISCLLSAISLLIMATPNFIGTHKYYNQSMEYGEPHSTSTDVLCKRGFNNITCPVRTDTGSDTDHQKVPFYIILVAILMFGCGAGAYQNIGAAYIGTKLSTKTRGIYLGR